MNLSRIGFYTLTDDRARNATSTSQMMRGELILSSRCNFKCPYCRSVGGPDIDIEKAKEIINLWADEGLKNIRFSGGEPTLYSGLNELVELARLRGVERVALSTNGSASEEQYQSLIDSGVDDFSISLDACCAEDGDKMAGGRKGAFGVVAENIRWLSAVSYVTVGVVLTVANAGKTEQIIKFADSLGVSDIRVIPAAQEGQTLPTISVSDELINKYPILAYRENNFRTGRKVRGGPTRRCAIVLDDMAAMGDNHYPCIIYMREGGQPIGKIGTGMRQERQRWHETHDCTQDMICAGNCLEVCVDYNTKHESFNQRN